MASISDWLVDGYNVMHTVLLGGQDRRDLQWWTESYRQQVIERAQYFEAIQPETIEPNAPKVRLLIVFDGDLPTAPEEERMDEAGPLHIVFTPNADEFLVNRARKADPIGSVAVVSADRKVVGRCHHAGAFILHPRDFLARCSRPPTQGTIPESP